MTVKVLPTRRPRCRWQPAPVAADDVLDDGEAEAGAAEARAARRVDPVEALGQARQVLAGDALALVDDRDRRQRRAPAPRRRRLERPATTRTACPRRRT